MRPHVRLTGSDTLSKIALVATALAGATSVASVGTGFVRFDVPKELMLHAFAIVLAALAIARADVRRERVDRVDRGAAIFALALVPAALIASVPSLVVRQGALTVTLLALFVHARRAPRLAADAAIVATVVLAASGLAEAVGGVKLSAEGFAPGGLTSQRNHLAHALALGLALVMARPAKAGLPSAVNFVASGVLAAALVVTRSRAGWLAAAVAFALTAIVMPAQAASSLLGTIGGVFVGLGLPLGLHWWEPKPYASTALRMLQWDQGSGRVRVDEARATWRLFCEHPVFGLGSGQWTVHYADVAPTEARELAAANGELARVSHVDLVARGAEYGLVGVAAALAWLRASVRHLRSRRALASALPFAAAFVVLELLDAGVSIPSTGLLAALGAASFFPRARVERPPRSRAWQVPVLVTAVAGIVVLLRVRAADRATLESTDRADTNGLVAACEMDPTAASHCVDAARHALGARDVDAARRAVAALASVYPTHPALGELRGGVADGERERGLAARR